MAASAASASGRKPACSDQEHHNEEISKRTLEEEHGTRLGGWGERIERGSTLVAMGLGKLLFLDELERMS